MTAPAGVQCPACRGMVPIGPTQPIRDARDRHLRQCELRDLIPHACCPADGCTHVETPKPGDAHNYPLTAVGERLGSHMQTCPHVDAEIARVTEETP